MKYINTKSGAAKRYSRVCKEIMKLFILVALFGLAFAQHNPHTRHGRTSIVHLFEWRWADIAAECERFLGPNGFGGVQVCAEDLGRDPERMEIGVVSTFVNSETLASNPQRFLALMTCRRKNTQKCGTRGVRKAN